MKERGSQQTRSSFFTLLTAVWSWRTWCHKMLLLIKISNFSRESEQKKHISVEANEEKGILDK